MGKFFLFQTWNNDLILAIFSVIFFAAFWKILTLSWLFISFVFFLVFINSSCVFYTQISGGWSKKKSICLCQNFMKSRCSSLVQICLDVINLDRVLVLGEKLFCVSELFCLEKLNPRKYTHINRDKIKLEE